VREVLQDGWAQTAPAGGSYDVTIVDNTTVVSGQDFGNTLLNPSSISGTIFHDLNANGVRDPGEPGLAGWTVFLDANNDGRLDPGDRIAVTAADGSYTIPGLEPGTYTVREVLLNGWAQSLPSGPPYYSVSLDAGAAATGVDFGAYRNQLTGHVFQDTNANGTFDLGETGLAGWQVYVDLNNSGVLQPGDPVAMSDANGTYGFNGLAPGTYIVREVLQAGWVQTTPADGFFTVTIDAPTPTDTPDFGNFQRATVSGNVYNDVNRNGVRDPGEPGLAGWIVYDDVNNVGTFLPGDPYAVSDAGGNYTLTNLGPGTHYLREIPLPTWVQTGPADNVYTITPTSGQSVAGRNFGNRLVNPASISGNVFLDLNADGVQEGDEPGLGSWRVYIDAHHNGTLDPGEQYVDTDAQGNFTLGGLAPGTYTIREVLQNGWQQSAPAAGSFIVTVTAGVNVSGLTFGNFQPFSISGTVFHDINGNGVQDPGEPGLRNWVVYDDVNNNGMLDEGTAIFEPDNFADNQVLNHAFPGVTLTFLGDSTSSVVALPTPPGSAGGLRVFGENTGGFYSPEFYNDPGAPPSSWWLRIDFATPVSTVSIDTIGTARFSGQARGLLRIFNSANQVIGSITTSHNLAGGELATLTLTRPTADIAYAEASSDQINQGVLLDNLQFGPWPTEPYATTDANGNYTLTGLRPGTHIIREVPQGALMPIAGFASVTGTSGGQVTGVNLANARPVALTGTLFDDTNGDGTRQDGEPGLAGWTVYADINNTGVLDPNDPQAVTDAEGQYTLAGLNPGTYLLRVVPQGGWAPTSSADGSVSVTFDDTAATVTGPDIGEFRLVTIAGTVYNDVNGNGSRDPGEPGLAGWIVYDDVNNVGVFLPGDPYTVSSALGTYTLVGVGPGTHHIREFGLPGWFPTAPAGGYTVTTASGQNVASQDFGNQLFNPASISGQVFEDLNGAGMLQDGDPGLAGWRVYIDANNNGAFVLGDQFVDTDAQGNFTLGDLGPGTYTIREVLQGGWRQSAPAGSFFTLTVGAGQNIGGTDFGNYRPVAVSGRVTNDATGAGLGGWTVFDDVHNTGVLDQTTFDPDNFADNQDLTHAFSGVTLSYLTDLGGSVIALPTPPGSAGGARVFGGVGDPFYSPEFYDDSTYNGYQLRINFAIPVSSVTIDAIGTARYSGLAKGRLRIFNAAGTQLAVMTSANFLAGGQLTTLTLARAQDDIAYALASSNDINYGVLLDNLRYTTDPFAVTAANGAYSIPGLAPGEHILREVVQPGWTPTTPPDGSYDINLVSGQSVSGLDFGNIQDPGPAPGPAPRGGLGFGGSVISPAGTLPVGPAGLVTPAEPAASSSVAALLQPAPRPEVDWASLVHAAAAHHGDYPWWDDPLGSAAPGEAWTF
jgi:protocatechuate 3,4-dioxygenase beta subunit